MALDFPNSPTNGQQYGGYTYDSTVGVWKANASAVAPTTMSSTAPANPTVGDQWFNTTDGTLYFYYYDGNTYQWVESRAPITADGYYSPNYIINGAFDIWQRGTSNTVTSGAKIFTADRFWNVFSGTGSTTFSRQSTGLAVTPYCLRVQRNSGNTNVGAPYIGYDIESPYAIQLAGKTVTLSFWARIGSTFSAATPNRITTYLRSGTGTDQSLSGGAYTGGVEVAITNHTLTTSWVRYTVTGTIPSNSNQVGFLFEWIPTGTAGANDYFEVAAVQLEEGAVATPFRRNQPNIQGELAACQRYYFRRTPSGTQDGYAYYGVGVSTTTNYMNVWWPVEMRTAPTSVEWSALALNVWGQTQATNITSASIMSAQTGKQSGLIQLGGTGFQNSSVVTLGASSGSSYIGFSAEL